MTKTAPQIPTYTPQTCRRCKGSGEYSWGFCYGCQGRGVVQIESGSRPMTADEFAAWSEYEAGMDAREAREATRKARMEARA